MRVAFFTHYAELYGANRSLLNLIEGLDAFGVRPFVICSDHGEMVDTLLRRRVPTRVIHFKRWSHSALTGGTRVRRLVRNLKALRPLLRQLRLWKVDVLYTNSSLTPVGAASARILRLPHVWHLREFGDLDYDLYPDWSRGLQERVIASASAQIAVSRSIRDYHLGRARRSNVRVIYNGVATRAQFDRLFQRAKRETRSRSTYVFALVGLVQSRKGQDKAIRALAIARERFPEAKLLIVGGAGEIEYFEQCRELVHSLGLERAVDFWGYVPDPYRAFLAADAVLVCSEHEAMGRVSVEAMSACRPVIGFDAAGTSELVEHEKTGLLYKGGPKELAASMVRCLEDPDWARQLGQNGWLTARERFSIERYAVQVYEVLRSVCVSPVTSQTILDGAKPEERWQPA